VALRGAARVGLLEDRHQPHEAHQPPDALHIHRMPFVLQMLNAIEGRVQELLVDQQHEGKVYPGLSLRLVVERGSGERQQPALHPDRQRGVVALDHRAPNFPVQGLSFRDEKSLATANSPISS
jgi:glucose dehydrogenase